jgi:gliding motility-associated-like protein
VKVTNASGCFVTATTNVVSPEVPVIKNINITNSNASILMETIGTYEYSLDGIQWQISNTFSNLANGVHAVFVRIKDKICSVSTSTFTIFEIPNVITPNGDNVNDTWKIEGIEVYKGSAVKVFNRFGETVYSTIISSNFEWDGKLSGRPLPTGNYFYIINLSDGRVLTGNLLIKNRN